MLILGPPGSGKSVLAEALRNGDQVAEVVTVGKYLRDSGKLGTADIAELRKDAAAVLTAACCRSSIASSPR